MGEEEVEEWKRRRLTRLPPLLFQEKAKSAGPWGVLFGTLNSQLSFNGQPPMYE